MAQADHGIPRPLVDSIRRGKCVPVIGAGFSQEAGVPYLAPYAPPEPSETIAQMINRLYLELLGRRVDDFGLQHWSRACGSDEACVRVGIIASEEYQMRVRGTHISGRGVVCNFSSTTIWLTVEDIPLGHLTGVTGVQSLAPPNCTNLLTQDAEAIWGRQCNNTRTHLRSGVGRHTGILSAHV